MEQQDQDSLTVRPTEYTLKVNANGEHVDHIPEDFTNGVYCVCMNRKERHVFYDYGSFKIHCKFRKCHKKWVASHNDQGLVDYQSQINTLLETVRHLKELNQHQNNSILKLRKSLHTKNKTIECLLAQLTKCNEEEEFSDAKDELD